MPILAKMAIGLSSSSQARLDAVVLLVEAVVSVAVLVGALRQALFCVVGGHDRCDGEDEGCCEDGFDDCCHCCCRWRVGGETLVILWWRGLGGYVDEVD
jgi:hypothetical protein